MNILNYLTPSFEEFVDAPVGADQLAHNSVAPGAAEVPGAAPVADAQTDSLEIPESVGPALVASADEVQAAAIVEDPGHSEAEAAAQQASDADAAVIEQAQVAPAETGSADAVAETTEEGTGDVSESTELGGDDAGSIDGVGGDTGDADLGTDTGDLGDAAGDSGSADLGDAGGTEEGEVDLGGDAELGDAGEAETSTDESVAGDAADAGAAEVSEVDEVAEVGETTDETTTEEDGLGETESTDGEEDGLGDGAEGGAETGETESEEETEEASETEGEETSGEFESESEETDDSEEETTETEEGEETDASEEGGDETDSDEDDGVEVDIPDVDTETTEDDAEEAEEEAAEAVAEDEALDDEIIDTSKSVDELDEDAVAVEEFIGVLQHGIRTKRFNAQTVALAQSKLQKLAVKWDSEAPCIPSMEDYTEKNLDAYYTNSLESFSGFLKKIKHVRDQFMDNFAKKMNEKMHLKAVETQLAAINKALDVQIMRVKDLKLESAVKVKVPAALRGEGGPIKAVTAELQWLGDVAGIFAHDRKFLEAIASLIAQAAKEGDALKATGIINKALKVPLPCKSYPASVYEGSKLSNFTFDRVEKKATGSMVQDMANLSERAIPTGYQNDSSVGNGPVDAELKKTDLVKMLQLAKVLIGLSRGTAAAAGKSIIDSIDTHNRARSTSNQVDKTGDKGSVAEADKALNHLATQFWYAMSASVENYGHFQWHLILLADNLVNLVKKVK
ncbi:hypothetical protein D3C86_284270 [compost metagenome]